MRHMGTSQRWGWDRQETDEIISRPGDGRLCNPGFVCIVPIFVDCGWDSFEAPVPEQVLASPSSCCHIFNMHTIKSIIILQKNYFIII